MGAHVAIAQDVADAGAGLIVQTDPASIASGLRRIMSDPLALQAMSRNAVSLANEKYTVSAMGARLKQLYTEILNR